MNTRAAIKLSQLGVCSASPILVIYGLSRLSDAWAFVIGSLFLGVAACVISKTWSPLPKSFWLCLVFLPGIDQPAYH